MKLPALSHSAAAELPEVGPSADQAAASPRDSLSESRARAPWKWILILAAFGVAVRAILLWLALPIAIQSDEANYLYLAVGLEHFGVYFDHQRYLWPPGYAWLMNLFTGGGDMGGLDRLRAFQVICSSAIGICTMLFAWRLYSTRAAIVAGGLWAVHVPLAAFTHLLWNETIFLSLFLPALWQLLMGLDRADEGDSRSSDRRLLLAGLLMGAALYVKEMPLLLVPFLSLIVLWRARHSGLLEAMRRGAILPLATVVVLLPWTVRNYEVYGRVVWGGATLGENAYIGLNARYMNFDFIPLTRERARLNLAPMAEMERASFTAPPIDDEGPGNGWARAEEIVHPVDRQKAQLSRGLKYAASHPGWFLRTRVKKWSDFVTPLSFFTRHHALGHYSKGTTLTGVLRKPLVGLSMLSSALILLLFVLGSFLTVPKGGGRTVVMTVIGYAAAASTLVAMSRFRLPVEPLLIAIGAGFLAHGPAARSIPRWMAAGACLVGLGVLWWIAWPETMAAASMALGGQP